MEKITQILLVLCLLHVGSDFKSSRECERSLSSRIGREWNFKFSKMLREEKAHKVSAGGISLQNEQNKMELEKIVELFENQRLSPFSG